MINISFSPAKNTTKKKIVILLIIILFSSFFASSAFASCKNNNDCQRVSNENNRTIRCIDGECVRALEVTYPQIQGVPTPKTISYGIPNYIKYIFNFTVSIIGLIILGALMYSGFQYLSSTGNPEKLRDAKDGIISAFLGAIILLSSYLIFHTINPELMVMKLPDIKSVETVVQPGIYICNYNVPKNLSGENLGEIINKYIMKGASSEPSEEQIKKQKKAAEELKKIMWNSDKKVGCMRANFSANLKNFGSGLTKDDTIFAIPSIKITPTERQTDYEYGLILHEKEDFSGKCYLVNQEKEEIYDQIDGFSAKNLNFTARSITVFQKTLSSSKGSGDVTLYECFNYNSEGPCKTKGEKPKQEISSTGLSKSFNTGGKDFKKFTKNNLTASKGSLAENTRSISFSSNNPYIALLFEKDNFEGQCQVVSENNPDLSDFPLGSCKCQKGSWYNLYLIKNKECIPCLNSMILIKGHIL